MRSISGKLDLMCLQTEYYPNPNLSQGYLSAERSLTKHVRSTRVSGAAATVNARLECSAMADNNVFLMIHPVSAATKQANPDS